MNKQMDANDALAHEKEKNEDKNKKMVHNLAKA